SSRSVTSGSDAPSAGAKLLARHRAMSSSWEAGIVDFVIFDALVVIGNDSLTSYPPRMRPTPVVGAPLTARRRPRPLPRAAEERLAADGHMAEYHLSGRLVARVYWHDTGAIEWEVHFDEQGRMHGPEREEHPDGRLKFEARWLHGLQHGP